MAKSGAFQKADHTGEVGFNMTPMIDCTFQLIIFFILTTQFATTAYAKDVEISRPDHSQAVPIKDYRPKNRVVINVVSMDARGKTSDPWDDSQAQHYEIGGEKYDVGNIDPIIELIKVARDRAEAAGVINRETGEEFTIEIRADKRINWQDVAPVIRAGVAANIRKMNITALTYGD